MEDLIFGGVSFNAQGFEVEDLSGFYNLPPKRGDNPMVPFRRGRIAVAKLYDQRTFSVGAWLAEGSRVDFQAAVDALKQTLGGGYKTLVKVLADGTRRTATAEIINELSAKRLGTAAMRMTIDFLMADPFWYGETAVESLVTVDTSPETFTVTNPGSAAAAKAVITFAVAPDGLTLENPKLTNAANGVWLQYLGTIAAGQTVTIDCGAFTAVRGSESVIGSLRHDGDAAFMLFEPGDNAMTLESDAADGSVGVSFYPPYL